MTEHDWFNPTRLWPLWHYLAERDFLSLRKKQLFAVAACRRVAHLLSDPRSLRIIDVCEGYADGRVGFDEFCDASSHAFDAAREAERAARPLAERSAAAAAKWLSPDDTKLGRALEFSTETFGNIELIRLGVIPPDAPLAELVRRMEHPAFVSARNAEELDLAGVVREMFGNPFRPVAFEPSWRTSTVLDLARTVYDRRDFAPMPVLADAIEEAGCDNADMLAHCRGGGPHVRGCWVIDLILGKN